MPSDLPGLMSYAQKHLCSWDEPADLKKALLAFEKALAMAPEKDRADLLAGGARAACRISEISKGADVATFADRAMTMSERGMSANDKRVEFPYYYAMALGIKLQSQVKGALSLLPKVEKLAKKAVDLNERYDLGGPLRLLGALYVQAPQAGSIGDPEKGVKILERAVKLFPDYPLNLYLLAEGLLKEEAFEKAEALFKKVVKAEVKGRWTEYDARHYRKAASAYIVKIQRRHGKPPGI